MEPPADDLIRGIREVTLLGLTALALFFLISLATFNLDDPGWSSSGTGATIKNAGGSVGAWISDFFLAVFGVMAALFPMMIGYRGILAYRGDTRKQNRWTVGMRWTGFGLTVLSGASLAYAHFVRVRFPLPETSGGLLGEQFGQTLIHAFGLTGATLLLLAGFLAGITLSTGFSWIALIDAIGKYTLILLDKIRRITGVVYHYLVSIAARRRYQDSEAVTKPSVKRANLQKSPKIEPVLKPIERSERDEKERQQNLFGPVEGALPQLSLLDEYPSELRGYSKTVLDGLSRKVEEILHDFGVNAEVVEIEARVVFFDFTGDLQSRRPRLEL